MSTLLKFILKLEAVHGEDLPVIAEMRSERYIWDTVVSVRYVCQKQCYFFDLIFFGLVSCVL